MYKILSFLTQRWHGIQRMLLTCLVLMTCAGTANAYHEEDYFTASAVNLDLTATKPTVTFKAEIFDDCCNDSWISDKMYVIIDDKYTIALTNCKKRRSIDGETRVGYCKYGKVTVRSRDSFMSGGDDTFWCYVDVTFHELHEGQTHKIALAADWAPNHDNGRYQTAGTWWTNSVPALTSRNDVSFSQVGPYKVKFKGSLKSSIDQSLTQQMTYTYSDYSYTNGNRDTYIPIIRDWINQGGDFLHGNTWDAYYDPISSPTIINGSSRSTVEEELTISSNYEPLNIRGRLAVINKSSQYFIYDDWEKRDLKHYIRPRNLNINSNSWDRSVELTWQAEGLDGYDKDGRWMVCRKASDESSWTWLKNISPANNLNDVVTCKISSDENLAYGKNYTYRVSFVPKDWGTPSNDNCKDLYADDLSKEIESSFDRSFFTVTLDREVDRDKVNLHWTTPAIGVSGKTFNVYRSKESDSGFKSIATVNAGKGNSSFTYTDNMEDLTIEYYYYVDIQDLMGSTFTSDKISAYSDAHTTITSFDATKGIYDSSVRLKWNVKHIGDKNTEYRVKRRSCGAQNSDSQEDWTELYTTSGTASSYTYTDQTASNGVFYEYCVEAWEIKTGTENQIVGYESKTALGFPVHTGQVSGSITFSGGTAVDSVTVILKPQSEDGEELRYSALQVDGKGGGLLWELSENKFTKNFGGSWTSQFFINPDGENKEGAELMQIGGFTLGLGKLDATLNAFPLLCTTKGATNVGDVKTIPDVYIPASLFSSLTLTYDGANLGVTRICETEKEDSMSVQTGSLAGVNYLKDGCTQISFAGAVDTVNSIGFKGFIDDIRLYGDKVLTKAEIMRGYNHMLSGKESKLVAYWPMDENMKGQNQAFDYSMTAGEPNSNHAEIRITHSRLQQGTIPSETLLALRSITDSDGNYTVNGVPYFNGGSTYKVIPEKGIHTFEPNSVTRYFSKTSAVYNGTDFTDKSSFPVSGVIYYENTNCPLEGANILVDGVVASKDGNIITTDNQGEFSISVAIGNHAITVQKDGHTFVNDGRYPSDKNQTHLFDREMKGLTFYDNTTIILAGRVAGGTREAARPLGFGSGTNNIGKATITLTSEYILNAKEVTTGTHIDRVAADTERTFSNASTNINSSAAVGAGDANCSTLTITTDSKSGEYAVKVPPLNYKVTAISVASNEDIKFTGLPEQINATNTSYQLTDSLKVGKDYQYFKYGTAYSKIYRTTPTLSIVDKNRPDGYDESTTGDSITYWIEPKEYTKADGTTGVRSDSTKIQLYTKDANGKTKYKFGHPVFTQMQRYTYDINGYEEYFNKDDKTDIKSDKVPLDSVLVAINNELSSDNYGSRRDNGELVHIDDSRIVLDSIGHGVYAFDAGYPRISDPFLSTFNASYDTGGQTYTWKFPGTDDGILQGYVFGQRSYGTNFVTAGPDRLLMVLRDPPGSQSTATWTSGTTSKQTVSHDYVLNLTGGNKTLTKAGFEQTIEIGAITGVGKITKTEVTTQQVHDVSYTHTSSYGDATTYTTTLNKSVSTSNAPELDGTPADIFIGRSTNTLFGMANYVGLQKNGSGDYKIGVENVQTMGEQLETEFQYTQYDIENTLIPRFIELRNALILSKDASKANDKPYYKYISKVDQSDPKFGQKDQYELIEPNPDKKVEGYVAQDSVLYYNNQVAIWQQRLADNEMAKITAIDNRSEELIRNLSISGGANVNESVTKTKSTSSYDKAAHKVQQSYQPSFNTTLLGFKTTFTPYGAMDGTRTSCTTDAADSTTTFSYTLADNGVNDALTVDVFNGVDGFSPIFVTRGGQTSGNWEPQRVTKYYHPGTEIMTQTVKIFEPKIYSKGEDFVSNVPSTGKAIIHLQLANESPTNNMGQFLFRILPNSDTEGCEVTCNGTPMSDGVKYYITPGQPVDVTVAVSCVDKDQLDADLTFQLIDLTSSYLKDYYAFNLASHIVHVNFVPGSSAIDLAIDNSVINENTGAKIRATISGYDLNLKNLQNICLQYRGESQSSWTTPSTARWRCSEDDTSITGDVLKTSSVTYDLDMSDSRTFPDQTYYLRAITNSKYGEKTVQNWSNELSVIKDMVAPQQMQTSPSNDTYSYNTSVYVDYNEDIMASEVTKDNVKLLAETNNVLNYQSHPISYEFTGNKLGAHTESRVTMPENELTIDMWVKVKGPGNILAQGTESNNLAFGITKDNKFYVKVGDKIVTSTADFPQNDWTFLSLMYNRKQNGGKLTATCCGTSNGNTVKLLDYDNVDVNGASSTNLYLGYDFNGCIHDISIWDKARDWTTANSQKWSSKTRFTSNLIAYWPLTEGHDSIASEEVSDINLILPSQNQWSLQNDNYALRLEKSQYAAINTSMVSTGEDDDYLLQLWFRADKNNTEDGNIFNLNNGESRLQLSGTDGGSLHLIAGTLNHKLNTEDVRDEKWHQLSIQVRKSTNANAQIYLDGKLVGLVSASVISNLDGEMKLGENISAYFDEVRLWKGYYSSDVINQTIYRRYNISNSQISGYYPMEGSRLGDGEQLEFYASLKDMGTCGAPDITIYDNNEKKDPDAVCQTMISKSVAPPLADAPVMQDVKFNLITSDKRIQLDITEEPVNIEGCRIYATVKDIKDKAGNKAADASWSFIVEHNYMDWESQNIDEYIDKSRFNEKNMQVLIIKNNTGKELNWNLLGAPDWLLFSESGGTLKANETYYLSYHINSSISIGTHHGHLYLVEENGITHTLPYTVTAVKDLPDWTVDKNNYENSMHILGQVKVNGTLNENPYSQLAVVRNDTVVGLASPCYDSRYDCYYVLVAVYGNAATKDPLTYRFYDANTGVIYPSVDLNSDITFAPNLTYGTMSEPLVWTTNNKIEQLIGVNKGWNWISFNNTLEDNSTSHILSNDEDIVYSEVVNNDNMLTYQNVNGTYKWVGDEALQTLQAGTMYKLHTTSDATITTIGDPVQPKLLPITINHGWNWLGANISYDMTVRTAMSDMNAQNGDMMKNHDNIAMFQNGDWDGDLDAVSPGVGYMYYSTASDPKEFHYPSNSVISDAQAKLLSFDMSKEKASATSAPSYSDYSGTMTVIAVLKKNNILQSKAQLTAYDEDGNIRGQKPTHDEDDMHLIYLVLHGDEAAGLSFLATVGEGANAVTYEATAEDVQSFQFIDGQSLGSVEDPVVFVLGEPTNVNAVNAVSDDGDAYTLSGIRVAEHQKLKGHIYVKKGNKSLKK